MKEIEKGLNEFKVEKPKTEIGRAWNWIWHSNSILSWLVALVLAFIIVKFIFFPLLSFALGTSLPLVVVESGSMSHSQASFLGNTFSTQSAFNDFWSQQGQWYQGRNITKSQFESFPLKTGLEKGDIVIVYGRGNLEVGDIIIFNANTANPIIHRIINTSQINGQPVYSTKGDNNPDQLAIEKEIPENALIGHAIFRLPKLGWLKLFFVGIFK